MSAELCCRRRYAKGQTFHDVKIGLECLLKHRMSKGTAIRNIPHKHLYHHEKLVHCLVETRRNLCRRGSPDRLLKVRVGRSITQLYCLDAPQKIMIAGKLRVASRTWECCFRHEFVRLIVQTVMEITAEKAVDK